MAHIYIAFVDTPGLFATMIHQYLKQKYIHVVISMDDKLEEAYSVGRRNPFIPILAGFEREDKNKIYKAFPEADYMICKIEVSQEQKEQILLKLRNDYQHRLQYHYAVAGLIFLVLKKAFYQKNHFTCSSYIAKLLADQGISIADKHFSLVTPKDFYLYPYKHQIFEGKLEELVSKDQAVGELEAAYEH